MYSDILSNSGNGKDKGRDAKPPEFKVSKADKDLLDEKEVVTLKKLIPRYPPSQVPDAELDDFPELTDKGFANVDDKTAVGLVFTDEIPDSGEREEFDTGSVRDTREGKGRFDLVSPIALKRIAQHYENGAKKYKDRNWEKGQKLTRYFDSAMRHMNDLMLCKLTGMKEEEDHLAAVAWNIMAIMHTEYMSRMGTLPEELIDWPLPKTENPCKCCKEEPCFKQE